VIAETNKKEKGLYNSKFYYISEMIYKGEQDQKVLDKITVSETIEGLPMPLPYSSTKDQQLRNLTIFMTLT